MPLFLQLYAKADNPERLKMANRLFGILDKAGVTDSLLVFDENDDISEIDLNVHYWSASYYMSNSQYKEALEEYEAAKVLAHQRKDVPMEGDCLHDISLAYFRLGDFTQAITAAKACYEIDLQLQDPERACYTLNTMAGIYLASRQPQKALRYTQQAIALAKELKDTALLATRYGTAAEVYHTLEENDKAVASAREALRLDSLIGDSVGMAVRRVQMAMSMIKESERGEALNQLQKAVPLLLSGNRWPSLLIALNQLGELYIAEHNHSLSGQYFLKALELATMMGDRYQESRAHHGLYKSLRDTDPEQAATHLDSYANLRDSIYDDDMRILLATYDAQFHNLELTEELASKNLQIRNQIYVALAILSVLLIIVVLLLLAYRKQRKAILFLQQQTNIQDKLSELTANESNLPSPAEQELLTQINDYVYRQMGSGPIDINDLASTLAMSRSTLQRKLLLVSGYTPANYVLRLRLNRACQLLRTQPDLPIGEIATICGFDSNANFARSFRQIYHQSPSDYRKGLDATAQGTLPEDSSSRNPSTDDTLMI